VNKRSLDALRTQYANVQNNHVQPLNVPMYDLHSRTAGETDDGEEQEDESEDEDEDYDDDEEEFTESEDEEASITHVRDPTVLPPAKVTPLSSAMPAANAAPLEPKT
jgi:hypothetical protein